MNTLDILRKIDNAESVSVARALAEAFVNHANDLDRRYVLRKQLAAQGTIQCVSKWAWNQQLVMDGFRITARVVKTGKGLGYKRN